MKPPTMLMQILMDSINMYKKNTYSLLNTYSPMFNKQSADNANEWIKEIDDTRLFLVTAVGEYLENHKNDEVSPENETVKTLEDEIAFWKEKYDEMYSNYKIADGKVTVLTNLIESYDKIQKEENTQ